MSYLLKYILVVIIALTRPAVAADLRAAGDVVPVTGTPFRGQLISIAADGMAIWKPEQGESRKLAIADLCWWGAFAEAPARTQIVLVDGSLILADIVALDKQQLTIDGGLVGEFNLPLEWIAGVLLSPPVDRQLADQLRFQLLARDNQQGRPPPSPSPLTGEGRDEGGKSQRGIAAVESASADTDRLILLNGDELSGEILALGDSTAKIRTAAGETSVSKEKIAAIAFDPSLATKPDAKQPRLWVGLKDGSRLVASAIAVEDGQARIKCTALPQLTVSAAKLVALQPLDGRTVYLSDLKPADYRHIPFLDLKWPYRTDRNVLGSQLRAGGRLYLKGIGMHTAARLTYDLPSPSPWTGEGQPAVSLSNGSEGDARKSDILRSARTFAAEAAIDDQTGGQGTAIFRVYTDDGSANWQLRYESPIVRGGIAPLPISVDIAGAKRVSLHVDFADHGDIKAHVDWLNARLLP